MPAFAAALLTVSLALAGCGAGSGDKSSASARQDSAAGPAKGAQDSSGVGSGDASSAGKGQAAQKPGQPQAGLHVIRTATLTVRVKDTQKALTTAREATERVGGFVENESTQRLSDSQVTSHIVLRVPQDDYDAVLAELAGTGTLLERKADAEDVTSQVVDTDSRVASQRASVNRVRALMDKADSLSDVVSLESELSTRQAALDSLLAEQASLKNRTTLATITLQLSEPAAKKQAADTDDDPGVVDALKGGWNAFTATLRWIAVVLGAMAPFLVALAVLYVLWRVGRRILYARRPAALTGPGTGAAPAPVSVAAPAPAPVREPQAPGAARDEAPDQE
ncbi:DUF4349 domain-containing protein [Streptomyces sp. 150FB]|uniref:DUF4349 domain-containing protein n=1 Tax=Streptomyces sp. 150FB TaxID=1576605 RepID=UPI001F26A2DD|nr:DUF4349 domain-containing protein [Streptomyces sp. 150FB]